MTHILDDLDKLSPETLWDLLVAISNAIIELDNQRPITDTFTPKTQGYAELTAAHVAVFDIWRQKHNEVAVILQQQNQ